MSNRGFNNGRLDEFMEEWQKETDRACAILGGSLLEEFLGRLLKKRLIEETPSNLFNQSLRDFAARIHFAYASGLLLTSEYKSLNKVREIRNIFAHHIDQKYSFETPEVLESVNNLEVLAELREWCRINGVKEEDFAFLPNSEGKYDGRTRFMNAVYMLGLTLEKREKEVPKLVMVRIEPTS